MIRMERVALYARVSTADKNQDPEVQLVRLRDYAASRGIEVVGEYVDVASGANPNRPQLEEMMGAARQRKLDTVIIVRLDRITRSLTNLLGLIEDLDRWGVHLMCLDQPIETGSASGRLLVHILGALAEFERELIRERVRDGMARAKREGRRIGRPRRSIDTGRARALLAEGLSMTEVAERMEIPRSTLITRLSQ